MAGHRAETAPDPPSAHAPAATSSVPRMSTWAPAADSRTTRGCQAYASIHQGLRRVASSQRQSTSSVSRSHRTTAATIAATESSTAVTARKKRWASGG